MLARTFTKLNEKILSAKDDIKKLNFQVLFCCWKKKSFIVKNEKKIFSSKEGKYTIEEDYVFLSRHEKWTRNWTKVYNWRVAQISSPLHMNGNTPKSFWQFRRRTLKGQLHILGFYTFIKKGEKNYSSIGSLQRCLSAFLDMDGLYWVCLGGLKSFSNFH